MGKTTIKNNGMDLLWENPNPTSSFPGQQLSISNLTKYSKIMLIARFSVNPANGCIPPVISYPNENGMFISIMSYKCTLRRFEIYSQSIGFEDAHVDGDGYTDSGAIIPYRIYGIK